MRITIRSAEAPDFPGIVRLIREFAHFQGAAGKVTITPEQLTADKELFRCLVAEDPDRQLVGFASFFYAYYSWTGRAIYLDDLYVTGAFRKQGIGRQLLEAVIGLARAEGCKKVRWQVSKWNRNAIGFYSRMGAVIDEVELNCDFLLDHN